ncbi:hypothetical protein GV054_09435 [Marinomonas mediterranea]|jgi:hypothetical protein|nr:hypothetical protein [Marinomonas mediterranea]WCN13211.1 hypothetical protein GV054_09435 [Marinomonas mediterranea]WCN17288.1 hypothetical protein GV053_09610 [Marinomonas mediterranea MMB-1]
MMRIKVSGLLSRASLVALCITGAGSYAMAGAGMKGPHPEHARLMPPPLMDGMFFDGMRKGEMPDMAKVEGTLARLSKELELDSETRIKVFTVLEKGNEEIKSLEKQLVSLERQMHRLTPSDEKYLEKVGESAAKQADLVKDLIKVKAKNKAALFAVLSSEQQTAYLELSERRPHRIGPKKRLPFEEPKKKPL